MPSTVLDLLHLLAQGTGRQLRPAITWRHSQLNRRTAHFGPAFALRADESPPRESRHDQPTAPTGLPMAASALAPQPGAGRRPDLPAPVERPRALKSGCALQKRLGPRCVTSSQAIHLASESEAK